MTQDVREKPYLNEEDVLALKFIRCPALYTYRRHYRQGLRSHIMEVLNPEDTQRESKGTIMDGLRCYPRAIPSKMLRIFRMKFETLNAAMDEVSRVRTIAAYLAPDHMAKSEEFLVTYENHGGQSVLLCGLQEYVQGEILDPWGFLDEGHLVSLRRNMGSQGAEGTTFSTDQWVIRVREKARAFIERLKRIILEAHHIPDLAGAGNLMLTLSGEIKLVDINNVSRVYFDSVVRVDDRGYPVCDKSIEALSLLEQKLLQKTPSSQDPIYKIFIDPGRMEDVKAKEEAFNLATGPAQSYSGTS